MHQQHSLGRPSCLWGPARSRGGQRGARGPGSAARLLAPITSPTTTNRLDLPHESMRRPCLWPCWALHLAPGSASKEREGNALSIMHEDEQPERLLISKESCPDESDHLQRPIMPLTYQDREPVWNLISFPKLQPRQAPPGDLKDDFRPTWPYKDFPCEQPTDCMMFQECDC